MFAMDMPYVPVQDTPIVLAQAASPGSVAPQPDYLFNACADTKSLGDPRSAERGVDPAYMLTNYLNNSSEKQVVFSLADIKNVTLLQGTTQGKITPVVDNTGLTSYYYAPPRDTRATTRPPLWPSLRASATRSWWNCMYGMSRP